MTFTGDSHTTLLRATFALAVGAAVGGALVAAPVGLSEFRGGASGAELQGVIFFFYAAAFVWGLGLTLVGAPVWWRLHRRGLRSRWTAALVGFGLPVVVTLLMVAAAPLIQGDTVSTTRDSTGVLTSENGVLTARGWVNQIRSSLLLGVAGVAVALVVHRIAYRRPRPA
ncbi:MAG: hypothetical protein U1C74_08780 [Phenylobacterium sp.]|nr:hypothetical protein [Phenylobacterium sp.]